MPSAIMISYDLENISYETKQVDKVMNIEDNLGTLEISLTTGDRAE